MSTRKSLSLKSLWINTDNYRFEPVESQTEAIAVMVEVLEDKLYNIAEHIVENGLNPGDPLYITDMPGKKGKYIVLEGNRRTTAMKVLENPLLLESTAATNSIKTKFKKLNRNSKEKIPASIECLYFENPDEADKWIKIKHSGENEGVGTVPWDAQQKARYQVRTGEQSSPGLQVIEFLKSSTDFDQSLKKKLPKVAITTLTRLLTDKDVQSVLGIGIQDGGIIHKVQDSEVIKGYTQVISDLLRDDFNVKSVYTKEQRESYARDFPVTSRPDLSSESSAGVAMQRPSSKSNTTISPASLPKPKKVTTTRNTVIPKTCSISIPNSKINDIYSELQKLKLTDFQLAPAALFRVFIELSFDVYIERHLLTNALSSARSGTALLQKGNQVISHMKNKKTSDDAISLGMKNLVNSKDSILSLETLHAYLHNHRVSPTPDILMKGWDSIEEFMIRLWNNAQ